MHKQNGYTIGRVCFWGMVAMLLIGCLPTTTPIEVERVSPEPTLTGEAIRFVNYVLPPQAKPTMKDFLDYEYFIPGSGEPIIPLVCVSWTHYHFDMDNGFEEWSKNVEQHINLTIDNFRLPYWERYERMFGLWVIEDDHIVHDYDPPIDCWRYEPTLGEHQAVFSVERTSGEVSTYSWVFTVVE